MNKISTDSIALFLLGIAALAVLVTAVWCIIENHREAQSAARARHRSQQEQINALTAEVIELRQQLDEFEIACRRMYMMLGEQSDSVASLKRQLKQLPPTRHRAIEATASTAEVPRIAGGRRVLESVAVGDIAMSSVPISLRERQLAGPRTGARRKPRH